MDLTTTLSLLLTLLVGLALGLVGGLLWARGRRDDLNGEIDDRLRDDRERATQQALVRDGLDRLQAQVRALEDSRSTWHGRLHEQVESLRRETASLATALRRPQVRGRWGELHLRRTVELAGLVDRVDFTEQMSVTDDDGVRRPDLVVHLAGGKQLVVDAKVPLDAFLDATSADDEAVAAGQLRRHAQQLRSHVDTLATKSYWRSLPATPEFVVLFVPGESFLSAALESDPSLLEYAAQRQVVLATPTTLIALLRTVAHAWTQETLAERAADIHALGRDLHDRLGVMGGHLDRLGRSLTRAVSAYNDTVGSLESRVLVSARRFHDLEVGHQLDGPDAVAESVRPLAAPELLDDRRTARRDSA